MKVFMMIAALLLAALFDEPFGPASAADESQYGRGCPDGYRLVCYYVADPFTLEMVLQCHCSRIRR